jgi:hypothetical protein
MRRKTIPLLTQEETDELNRLVKTDKDATARRHLKASGRVWKRVRRSLADRRDEDSFRLCKQALEEHLQAAGRGEIKLACLDESGFNGEAYIPYAWQKKGETFGVSTPRGNRINVPGMLSASDGSLTVETPKKMTAKAVVEVLNRLSETTRTDAIMTVLVLDNATIHTAKIVQEKLKEWEGKNLFLYYLPPYSPELNLIEILWCRVKYEWLPFEAYQSRKTLREWLDRIFSGYGKKYTIIYR